MALFIFRFWPVFIPLFVYILWMISVRNKARKAGAPLPHFGQGPWFWTLVATLALAVCMFVFFGLSHESNSGEYIPPHMENGKVVSGEVKAP